MFAHAVCRPIAVVAVSSLFSLLALACQSDEAGDATGEGSGSDASSCFELSDGRCVEETFANPRTLEPSSDGVYKLTLAATEIEIDGQRHCVRAYNGDYTAPTIDVAPRAGDAQRSIRVNLANLLRDHDYRSLDGDACSCANAAGDACFPEHIHDACLAAPDADDCVCTNEDGELCEHMFDFNVTNLHFHGGHLRPDYARGGDACVFQMDPETGVFYDCRACGDDVCDDDPSDDTCYHGDDVLNAVHPFTGAQYRWDIDEDGTHHTGMQWYHPHIHGTTAMQVASGAAGALIVRGALDQLDGIADANERVMIFSTPSIASGGFEPLTEGESCTDATITFNNFKTLADSTVPQMNVLNGVRQPRLITAPGQVERWQILHAGYLDEVFIGVFRGSDTDCSSWNTREALQLTQMGRDGLIMPQTFEDDYVFMSPGYRIDAIVGGEGELADGDNWCMVSARFLQESEPGLFGEFGEQAMSPREPITVEDILTRFETGDLVAVMNVTETAGAPSTTQRPDFAAVGALADDMNLGGVDIAQHCEAAAAIEDPEDIDQVAILQVGFWTLDDPDPCECEPYNVNCHNYEYTDRSLYPYDRDLVLGAVDHWRIAASVDGHPFHIHINPFVVCPNDNVFDPIPFPHWRDTYLVNLDRQIDIITQYKTHTGPFVFHCHKLTHEDHGMMEVMRVCDPATDDTCGQYAWRECEPGDLHCVQALASTDCALNARSDLEAAACITTLGGPGGVCAEGACTDDAHCEDGATCLDNTCVPSCMENADCPESARCDAGVCVPAVCESPCAPGQRCVHGVCV